MKNKLFPILFFSVVYFSFFAQSQTDSIKVLNEIKGTITDESTNEPLIGAIVSYENGKGVTTDVDGNFKLNLPNGSYELKLTYVGYKSLTKKIKINGSSQVLNFKMASSTTLDEVEVAADVAKIRETPVAVSNISAQQIKEELGARDLPMLLNSTPGVYATQQGGGAGDARVNIRGFDQRYVAVLVDGVPVNDMENGQVYWSNWSGLSEVTKNLQVQRGLGASRLAIPSVGGVMNIITSSIDEKRYFVVKSDLGTNNYQRVGIGFNSGILKNKFGITLSGSYTGGDGWVDKTWQKAWSYFAKITYRINDKSLLVLGVSGAPQSHAQKTTLINMAYYDRDFAVQQGINADSIYANTINKFTNSTYGARGLQYNPDWGYVNGKVVNTKVNYFHKPLFNLSYFLTINPRLTYSNVFYVSLGRGGGTSLSNSINYDKNGNGQLLLQQVYDKNITTAPWLVPNLKQASNFIYSSINNHDWAGLLSTLKYQVNKNLHFIGGIDGRYYSGTHYQTPYDLLGADYVQQPISKDKSLNPLPTKDPYSYVKKVGDKINYYYQSKVTWLGLFTQLEYKTDKISAFLTLTGSQTSFQSINYFEKKDVVFDKKHIAHNALGYGDTLYYDGQNYGVRSNVNPVTQNGDGSITFLDNLTNKNVTIGSNYSIYHMNSAQARVNTTDVKYFYGYTAKGGLNYKITENHNVFVNVGYLNVTPKFSNVFDRSGVQLSNITNQFITAAELGYGIKYSNLAVNVNGYITKWDNKPLDFGATTYDKSGNPIYYNIPGVDAILKGIELDYSIRITKFLKVEGFGMLADWRWNSGGIAYVFAQDGTLTDSVLFNAKGVHLGNSPQQQLGGSLRFEFKGFYIKPQYTYFNKMYAQFDPTAFQYAKTSSDYRGKGYDSWKTPGYGLFDLFIGYKINSDKVNVTITASMNNVLSTTYLTDASFPSTSSGIYPDKYNALNSYGFMGQGRRINLGVRITF